MASVLVSVSFMLIGLGQRPQLAFHGWDEAEYSAEPVTARASPLQLGLAGFQLVGSIRHSLTGLIHRLIKFA